MSCECEQCQYSREVNEQLALLPEAQRKFFRDMYLKLFDTQADLNYLEVIKDGSWPNSVEILTNWLENARQKA